MQAQSEAWFLAVPNYGHKEYLDESENLTQEIELGRDNEAGSTILINGQTLQGTGFKALDGGDLTDFLKIKDTIGHVPPIRLTTEDVTRYKMAWRGFRFSWSPNIFPPESFPAWRKNHWRYHIPNSLVQRCKDWPDIYDRFELLLGLGFTTAGLIYGGLHALAWFAHFGSSTQQLLWRISACMVMGGFPVCWVLVASGIFFIDHATQRLHFDHITLALSFCAAALVALAYMLARAYLVVECFINLSHLPAGVYDVPQWASYFPHIS